MNLILKLRLKNRTKRELWYFIFVLPALIMFIFAVVIPLIQGFYYSFTNWDGVSRTYNYIGMRNFINLIHDKNFYITLINTLKFAILATILENILGLLLALVLDTSIKGKHFFRTLFFLPTVITPILAGFIWSRIYDSAIPKLFSIFGINDILSPLGNAKLALYGVVLIQIWLGAGFAMIIYIAGLQGIPGELLESSRVDGANTLQQIWSIKLPLLAPAITINFVSIAIQCLKIFDIVFVATSGGPGYSTETIAMLIYQRAFGDNIAGYSTAIGVVFFFIILFVSLIQIVVLRKREVEL